MKRSFLVMACSWIVLMAFVDRRASAQEREWKVIAGYDYYFPGEADRGLRDQIDNEALELVQGQDILGQGGYDSASYSLSTNGGSGAHVGILYPFADRVMLGGTVGYVIGPTMNANFTAQSPPISQGGFGNGGFTLSRAATYIRVLPDVRVNLLQGRTWGFDFDSEWGWGYGRLDQSCSASGSIICPFNSASKTWAGFTWEVSPTITLKVRDTELNLSLRYAGFPRFSGTDQFPALEWRTYGISLGAVF